MKSEWKPKEYKGETFSLQQWHELVCNKYGIDFALQHRVKYNGGIKNGRNE